MNFEALTELTTFIQRGVSPKYADSGIPVINQKCIRNGQLKRVDIKFHSSEKTYSKEKALRKNDILVNSTGVGTLGRVARFSSEDEDMLADSHVTIVRPDVEKILPLYLFYVLRLNEATIVELGAGSTGQTELSRTALGSLQIPIPSQSAQKYIAHTLAYIDERIDTNETLCETLEGIAQTIFKSWFIDFDPVKVKMAGENPMGIDAAVAALFPDSLEESELGFIPKGWMVSNLESISSVKYGAPFASKLFNTLKVGQPLIRIRDLKNQSISTWSPEHHPKGFLVSGGELLVGMDGEFNPTIWFGPEALVNQRMCKIEPKDFVSNFFLYFTLVPIMKKIEHGSTGSTVIHLGKTDIDAIKIAVPSKKLLSAFKTLVEPLLKQMVSLNVQIRILQEARDTLLPRLISGELQIPEEMLAS